MRRRTSSIGLADLATFDLVRWEDPTDPEGFERYVRAMVRWREARDRWADETGFEGNEAWWDGMSEAIAGMPDEPWDPSKL